ncbi:type II secretion system F family protein [Thiomicrospira sp.]|uniref:type II secretion system F family protein n=1 Tax=Thiomicrospira sp. TaxID=935 RepID=UPI002F949609
MDMISLLVITGSLIFLAVLALSKVLFKQHDSLIQMERLKARIGVGQLYTQIQTQTNNCWWCLIGTYLGSKNLNELEKIQNKLVRAGFRKTEYVGAFYFFKTLFILAVVLLASLMWIAELAPAPFLLLMPVLSILLPEYFLNWLGNARLNRISRSLPDFLDMANVCMNAGLSWMVAVKRVAHELKDLHPDICFEFNYLLEQIQIGVPRIEALRQFSSRNKVRDIEQLVLLLIQNEKLGSPVSDSIRVFSKRMYDEREEMMTDKAAKASAKMAIIILPFLMLPYFILLLGEKFVLLGRSW